MNPAAARTVSALRWFSLWAAAVLLGLLPGLVAADFGGVLWWTHYATALAVFVAFLLAVLGWAGDPQASGLRQHMLLAPLVLWALYGWFQTVSLPAGLVAWLSPGSHSAYTDWIAPFLGEGNVPSTFPISLDPYGSRHALSIFIVIIAVAWATATVARSRAVIGWFLTALAISAAGHAALGILGLVDARTFGFVDPTTPGAPFGTFVNRNNAALLLNIGLACSLGLLSWRLAALTGVELDDEAFEFNDLVSLVSDRESIVGIAGALLCLGGLLVNGSRGGIAAIIIGMLLALGWVRRRRGMISLPIVLVGLIVCVAVMLVPTNLTLESIQRLQLVSEDGGPALLQNGRLDHWPDGWQAAQAHLPAGSGLATYAYAYLPYQQTSPEQWFEHADNLWLELIVEQGLVGIALALSIVLLIGRSLHYLALSPDPIDQGLRITGWYLLGAVLASQFFDFGLIVPANLLAVTVLSTAITARQAAAGNLAGESEPQYDTQDAVFDSAGTKATARSSKKRSIRKPVLPLWIVPAALAAVVTLAFAAVLPLLGTDATVEAHVRRFDAQWPAIKADEEKLARWQQQLVQLTTHFPRPALQQRLADVRYQQGRLEEVTENRPRTIREFQRSYRATGPLARRVRWYQQRNQERVGRLPEPNSGYSDALAWSTQSLLRLPLSPKARPLQIYLDFVHEDRERTRAALKQLRQFYTNHAAHLIRLGSYATAGQDTLLAAELWRQALQRAPQATPTVLELVRKTQTLRALQVMPDSDDVFQRAASVAVRWKDPDPQLMEEALARIDCDTTDSPKQRSECAELRADLAYQLSYYAEAFQTYEQAVKLTPANLQLRLKLIDRLRQQGRLTDARRWAQQSRSEFPDQAAQFKVFIDRISEEEERAGDELPK